MTATTTKTTTKKARTARGRLSVPPEKPIAIRVAGDETLALAAQERLERIPPKDLVTSPLHRRRSWGDLEALTASIRENGIVQALTGRRLDSGGVELIAGERRRRAAIAAYQATVPVLVREYMSDAAAVAAQIAENLQRADVHPMDEAELYEMLRDPEGRALTIERIAAENGKTPAHVRQRLQLCKLSGAMRELYLEGKLTHAMAFALARLPDHAVQDLAAAELQELAEQRGIHTGAGDDLTEFDRELEELTWQLTRRYMHRLAQAPFDTADAALTDAGACTACPHRSGAQRALFEELDDKQDACLRPPCWQAKVDATWSRAAAAAKSKGLDVVEGTAAEKLFSEYSHSPALNQQGAKEYVLADAAAGYDERGRLITWRQAVKKAKAAKDVRPVVLQGPGGTPVTAYPAGGAKKAFRVVKAAQKEGEAAAAAEKGPGPAERDRKILKLALMEVGRVADLRFPEELWPILARCLVTFGWALDKEMRAAAEARKVTRDELEELMRGGERDEFFARSLVVELLVRHAQGMERTESWGQELLDATLALNIEEKQLGAQVDAELAGKAAAPAPKTAKKKAGRGAGRKGA